MVRHRIKGIQKRYLIIVIVVLHTKFHGNKYGQTQAKENNIILSFVNKI